MKEKKEEEKLKDNEIKSTLSILFSGIALIIGFLAINGIDYTGFSVVSKDYLPASDFLGIIIIFTSFVLIIVGGIRLRKIEKNNKHKKSSKEK